MSGIFSRPAPTVIPPTPPTPPPPMPDSQSAQAMEAARRKAALANAGGRASTMLSDNGSLVSGGGKSDYSSTKLGG